MQTQDDRRWPVGQLKTPPRSGKLPDYDKFDASFFTVHAQQANVSLPLPFSILVPKVPVWPANHEHAWQEKEHPSLLIGRPERKIVSAYTVTFQSTKSLPCSAAFIAPTCSLC